MLSVYTCDVDSVFFKSPISRKKAQLQQLLQFVPIAGSQRVLNWFSRGSQRVLKGFPTGSQRVLRGFSTGSQGVLNGFPTGSHGRQQKRISKSCKWTLDSLRIHGCTGLHGTICREIVQRIPATLYLPSSFASGVPLTPADSRYSPGCS